MEKIMMNNSTKQILLTFCFSTLMVGCSQQKSADEYLEEAKLTIASGESKSAVIALKNSIQVDAKNAEARYLLGQIYLSQDNTLNAIKELERAKEYRYSDSKVLPLLANAYYLNEDFQSLVELDAKQLTPNESLQVKYFQALAHTQLQQIEEAKTLARDIVNADDSKGYEQLIAAYIAYQEQDIEKAKQSVEEALSLLPAQPQGLLLLGHIGSASRNPKMAAENYKKYLKEQPNQRSAELMLANALLLAGDFEQAEQHADNIIALVPNQAFANYIKAMVRIEMQDYENANKHAELAINNKFNQPNIKLVAGVSAFYLKKYEQSLYYLKPLLAYLPENHFGRKMVVVSQMELGLIEDAADTVDSLGMAGKGQADFYSALSYRLLQAGAKDEAAAILAKQGTIDSKDPGQLFKDGLLRMMADDQTALNSLEKAVELDPKLVQAELALAYMAVRSGEMNKALAIAKKWQEKYQDKADGYNLESAIALRREDVDLAKKLLLKGLEVEENNLYTLTQLAQVSRFNGDEATAKSYVNKALEIAPDNLKVLRIFFDISKDSEALSILKDKVVQNPESENLRLVLAEAQFKLGNVDEGITQLNDISPSSETPKLYWQLRIYGAKQSRNKVMLKSSLDEWRKLNPYHIENTIYLAEYHALDKNYDRALRTIDQGLDRHRDNLMLSLIKTQLLLDSNDVDSAQKIYNTYQDKVATLPARFGIEGRIAMQNKDFERAVKNLTQFYQSQPTGKNLIYLASALVGNEQKKQAIATIQQHLATIGGVPSLYSLLGSLQLEVGERDSALKVYEHMITQQPNNFVAVNNVAWLYMEQGKLSEALKFAEKAVELAPEHPNVIDTYGKILLKSGESRKALAQAKVAYELSKGKDTDIALNYVEALVANQRKNLARQIMATIKEANKEQVDRKYKLQQQLKS